MVYLSFNIKYYLFLHIMKKQIFVILAFLFSVVASGQKQANIWHFGDGKALDFSSGNPVQLTGSAMQSFEGSASYCDSLGNLLFYTNGGGREPLFSGQDGGHIWNQNNAVMYDMLGTEGGGFSAAQSSVIFEAPGQIGIYYVFTMDEVEHYVGASPATTAAQPLGRGLRYFTVDMNLNGGLGGVVLADQQVYQPSYEGLCAIRHANKRDYWILINQDSTGIGVYQVAPTGVSFVSNYTAVGRNEGLIKASPDGSKIKIYQYLLDFDNNSGTISNPLLFTNPGDQFEFSPNSKYLYEIANFSVLKYDLQAASIPNSATSIGIINVGFGTAIGQMQLGPDGKIYYLTSDLSQNLVTLARINCPNTSNAAIQPVVLNLSGLFFGLPNFPAWLFENYDSISVSLGPDTLRLCNPGQNFTLDAQNTGASYLWSNGSTTQSISVNTAGTYSVTVTGPCGNGTDRVVVTNCSPVNNNCLVFEYTGAPQQWIVPAGIDSIKVKMWGGAGGGGPDPINCAGGAGGYTEVTIPVQSGQILDIFVGGGGGGAIQNTGGVGAWPNGGPGGIGNRNEVGLGDVGGAGGGGGRSQISLGSTIYAIAGAGGGASLNRNGGAGGGLIAEYTAANNQFNLNGFGGTQTAGGNASSNTICGHPVSGTAGSFLQGGQGASDIGGALDRTGGGGGGDGYYGGGGGGSHDGCFGVGSTGGGGSGFVCSSCPGVYGFTLTGSIIPSGIPANSNNPLFQTYPGIATGVNNQNGGHGIVQICFAGASCIPTSSNINVSACNSYTAPSGAIYTNSGVYVISDTINNSAGCDSIISINLTLNPFTNTQLNITACDSFTDVNGNTYYQSTVFNYTLTGSNGCDSIVSINLTINGTIQAPVQNVSACNSFTAPWGTTYTQSGIYSDTLTSSGGCDSVISINLSLNGIIQTPIQNISSCSTYTAPWGTTYNQSGIYSDTIFSPVCDSLLTINLNILQNPTVNILWDSILCTGETLTLNAIGVNTQSYLWSDGSSAQQLTVSNAGTYSVTVENNCGQAFSSINVLEENCDTSQCSFLIPNAFTPNADGVNDNWYIQCIELYPDNEVEIYNRWGQQVYTRANYTGDWDGTQNGSNLPDAAYYYILKIKFPLPTGERIFTGTVSIIR